MTLFKRIEVDIVGERSRIKKVKNFTKQQCAALNKVCDLLEAGKWQECLDHVNDERAFPYNEEEGYPEREHIGTEIADLLMSFAEYTYYTIDQCAAELKRIHTNA